MNKKYILRLLLLATVLFFFNSCRTDEVTQEENRAKREKIEAFSRFENKLTSQKILQKGGSEYVSYHEPFKEIIQTFMSNNSSYSKRFNNDVGDIYFNLRSITYGETTKGLAYPIIKDGAVNAVLVGLVSPERDWVNFIVLKNNSPEVQSMISNFQNAYNSPSIASRGGQPEQTEEILPVIINVYGDITGPVNHYYQPYVDYGSNGSGMSGGSETYGGASGSQNQSVMAPPPPPDLPINDIKSFLSCLNINQPANLTVYAAEMFSSSKSGHAFISITQGTNTMTFGFYPKTGLAGSITGPGVFGNDGGHAYSNAWNVGNVSPAQLQNIIATAVAYSNSNYDLGFNNCVDFTIGTLNNAGINFTSLGVDTPTSFSNTIKSSATGTNGNAPQTKGCK